MKKTIYKTNFCLFLLLIFYKTGISSGLPDNIRTEVSKKIVQIHSGGRVATGFLWSANNLVVTCLHAIGDPNNISVTFPNNGNAPSGAHVINVYSYADIVLLKVDESPVSVFLPQDLVSTANPGDNVFAVGFYNSSVSYIEKDFTVGVTNGNTLREFLKNGPDAIVQSLGAPDLSSEIVYLGGQLLHGFSGSPIVDNNGNLIGIANGGLENGSVGISWCTPAKYLANLVQSNESFRLVGNASNNMAYSSATEDNITEASFSYGDYTFTKYKTKTFSEIQATMNNGYSNAIGLQMLVNYFTNMGIDCSTFRYDVYVEETTGATIVVPEGMSMESGEQQGITGVTQNGSCKMIFDLMPTADYADAANKTNIFIHGTVPNNGAGWVTDVNWTYNSPVQGPGGTISSRAAYGTQWNCPYNYEYEAFDVKNNNVLVCGTAQRSSLIVAQQIRDWAQCAIAIQLMAFSF